MKKELSQNVFFIITLTIFSIASLYLLLPFFTPILWAGVFSMVLYPIYKKIKNLIKNDSLSSIATIFLFLVVVFAPASLFFANLTYEAKNLYNSIVIDELTNNIEKIKNDYISKRYTLNIDYNINQIIKSSLKEIAKYSSSAIKVVGDFTISFFIMLYIMYFFLKDGKKLTNWLKKVMPTKDEDEQMLFDRFYTIVHSVFKGTFAIAFIQSFIGSIALFTVGVSNISIYFTIMFLMAIIPAVGPALVIVLFSVYFLIKGYMLISIFLIAVSVIIGVIDNLLRPILVGKSAKLHDLVVALSIFGGLASFGFSGLILGPVILALTISMWEMYEKILKKS